MRRTPIAHVVFPRPNRDRPVSEFAWDAARRVAEARELEVEILVPVPLAPTRALTSKVREARGARAWPDDIEQVLSSLDPKPTLVPYIPVPRRSIESAAASLSAHLVARRRARRPSVIHGSFLDEGGYAAVSAARALGIGAIAVGHGSDVVVAREEGHSTRAGRSRTTLHHAGDVVCVSQALAAEIAHFGRTAEIVRYGADEKRFPLSPLPLGAPVVLFVGRLSRAKGVDVLLEAMARTKLTLELVGPADDIDVEAEVKRLGIGDRVRRSGEVAHDALAERYAAASVVVLPSRTEGFGCVLVEALLTGRPIVTTAVGGMTEIATPSVGRVVPPGDPEALARAIEGVYGARWKPEALRKHALPFSWGASGERLIEITLARLAAGPRS